MDKIDYDEACRRAATAQGLDPVTDTLAFSGIDHEVYQTGGFNMVVIVPVADGKVGVTVEGEDLVVYFYRADAWDEGDDGLELPGTTLDGLPNLLRALA